MKHDSFQAKLRAGMEKLLRDFGLKGIALFDAQGLLIEVIVPHELKSLTEIVASYGLVIQEQIKGHNLYELTLIIDRQYRMVNGYFRIKKDLFVVALILIPDQPYNNLLQLSITEMKRLLEERYSKAVKR